MTDTITIDQRAEADRASYQARVKPWLDACFGSRIASDTVERNHRFLEESLELVQSTGCTHSEAHQLVDYVFGRTAGEPGQEVGGVMNTLAALCLAHGLDMHEEGERELARVWQPGILEKIRAKQVAKPKHSPLAEAAPRPAAGQGAPVVPPQVTDAEAVERGSVEQVTDDEVARAVRLYDEARCRVNNRWHGGACQPMSDVHRKNIEPMMRPVLEDFVAAIRARSSGADTPADGKQAEAGR